jgi:hypothetical protein
MRELKGIVTVVRAWWQVKDGTYLPQLSRNEKRSFALLVKYIDKHYDQIVPLFRHMVLIEDDGELSGCSPAGDSRNAE